MSRSSSEEVDREALLAALNAHGQNFMSSFASLAKKQGEPSRKRRKIEPYEEHEEEEWTGFGPDEELPGDQTEDDDLNISSGDEENDGEEYIEDDEFRSDMPTTGPQVVVFFEAGKSGQQKNSMPLAKSFMSSKVSKLREEAVLAGITKEDSEKGDENEDDRTNLQNDKLLRELIHTKLLSGSLNEELDLTSAQKKRALAGRVLELASGAKLGKGESVVRNEERSKAAKRVRLGLERKAKERNEKEIEEAKNLGNYHRSIKHVFDTSVDEKSVRKKRDRGLRMGVGKFSGGVLKLSKEEIASVQARSNFSGRGRQKPGSHRKKGSGY